MSHEQPQREMEAENESLHHDDDVKISTTDNRPESPKRPASPSTSLPGSPSKRAEIEIIGEQNVVKTIYVVVANGSVETVDLGSDGDFREFRYEHRVACLVSENGHYIYGFKSLIDGATYTLGPSTANIDPPVQTTKAAGPQFPYDKLNAVDSIPPPPLDSSDPEFVSEDGWLDQVTILLRDEFRRSDTSQARDGRVRPLALVGCSRSGKTRALKELARHLKHVLSTGVIFVSFNDYSHVTVEDEKNPLQALCKRIAFEATCKETTLKGKRVAYELFDSEEYIFNPVALSRWLGVTPVVLLIDELNSLKSATKLGTTKAKEFGDFIRRKFLVGENRYTVFSTHTLSTLHLFVEVVDSSDSSDRTVRLHSLPLIPNLAIAREKLNSRLNATDAIYYGLMPAMIFTQPEISVKQMDAVDQCNRLGEVTKVKAFRGLLRSLFTGAVADVPEPLYKLLATRSVEDKRMPQKISWVPFLLEYVLRTLNFEDTNLDVATSAMADLLHNFKHARKGSGDAWENLFTFQLLARCFARQSDGVFVPEGWFRFKHVKVEYNEPERLPGELSSYKTWQAVLKNIQLTEAPTIFIFFPVCANFHTLDVMILYWEGMKLMDVFGYQLKEGNEMPGVKSIAPAAAIQLAYRNTRNVKSFWVNGKPTQKKLVTNGWSRQPETVIDRFFGESGRYWTPMQWSALSKAS